MRHACREGRGDCRPKGLLRLRWRTPGASEPSLRWTRPGRWRGGRRATSPRCWRRRWRRTSASPRRRTSRPSAGPSSSLRSWALVPGAPSTAGVDAPGPRGDERELGLGHDSGDGCRGREGRRTSRAGNSGVARVRVRGHLVQQHRDGGALPRDDAEGGLESRGGGRRRSAHRTDTGRRASARIRLPAIRPPAAVGATGRARASVGASLLRVMGASAAAVFAVTHGAGNGILATAKGTLPLVLFGPQGYGERLRRPLQHRHVEHQVCQSGARHRAKQLRGCIDVQKRGRKLAAEGHHRRDCGVEVRPADRPEHLDEAVQHADRGQRGASSCSIRSPTASTPAAPSPSSACGSMRPLGALPTLHARTSCPRRAAQWFSMSSASTLRAELRVQNARTFVGMAQRAPMSLTCLWMARRPSLSIGSARKSSGRRFIVSAVSRNALPRPCRGIRSSGCAFALSMSSAMMDRAEFPVQLKSEEQKMKRPCRRVTTRPAPTGIPRGGCPGPARPAPAQRHRN